MNPADSDQPSVKDVLQALDLGSSVAEHDELLRQHFVETSTFKQVLQGKKDVVAGDKGTGKTAIFRILSENYTTYPELNDVEVIAAFNPAGTPIFQRLLETATLDENQYISVWKVYFVSLAGNWILNFFDGDFSDDMKKLNQLLTQADLRSVDDTAQTIFAKLISRLKRLIPNIKSLEGKATASAGGIPILSGKLEFGSDKRPTEADPDLVRPDDALALVQKILVQSDIKLWLVVDRLDEAFQGQPIVERPALRALFRTYLDMLAFDNMRLKLFVRHDLFSRIIVGGFVNLTHINARRVDITWDDEDLWDLLQRRMRSSAAFIDFLDAEGADDKHLFNIVFPDQVDQGSRRPETWAWILTRVRDANGVKPPRNLIDLVLKAQYQQSKREERDPRRYKEGERLIAGDALKKGLQALSEERVQDTLLAEAGEDAQLIEFFRNGKAEHNLESLTELFSEDVEAKIELLKSLGFLEPVGSTYKVPMLYRGGLNITQGKAFSGESDTDEDE
ncbi:P-loop ATPase, Sll1717 family [Mycobacteroides abscessus]|uniref:P-loop ATPase, Sll1717 family n=1 Tax=Mycobacteroides abscessus TaxID=36809 RepID=UPI002670BAFB|nr:hypothetical protein [Mycobacteroides abscessus]MDO3107363.1 hypothetical protein [Mycobacteroides abscessus subsp. abscessus]